MTVDKSIKVPLNDLLFKVLPMTLMLAGGFTTIMVKLNSMDRDMHHHIHDAAVVHPGAARADIVNAQFDALRKEIEALREDVRELKGR